MSVSGAEDMAGNLWEWCLNKFDDLDHTEVDATNDPRVLRGGSWNLTPGLLRSALRSWSYAGSRGYDFGFRLVCRPPSSFGH